MRELILVFAVFWATGCNGLPTGQTGALGSPLVPGGTPPGAVDPGFATRVLELTNSYRSQNGVAPLTWSQSLGAAAQSYAESMLSLGFFSHTGQDGSSPGDRIAAAGYVASTWGENIAYGYSTPETVMEGWINSAAHRANILNASFTQMGVGYAGGGTVYWVQDFGAP